MPTKEIQGICMKGPQICICYRWNSVGGGSVRAGFNFSFFPCFSLYLFGSEFLVACYATLHQALSIHWSVHPSVRSSVHLSVRPSIHPSIHPSVRPSHFIFSKSMGFLAIPLLPKCSTDIKYSPCPPARNWGSRVSGLV